jgi:acetyl esterase/lipase
MSHAIEDYQADYFIPVVREVLDEPLAAHGFTYAGDHRDVTAYWTSGRLFFRVGYLPETMPCYELLLGIGLDDASPLEPKSSANSIGVWRLLPGDVAPQIANWRFDAPERLRRELGRAWTEAIVPYVTPLWSDPDELARLIAGHDDELAQEDQQRMNDRLLRYARSEFAAGHFPDAVHAYDELPAHELTRADRKRIELARRRM